MTDIGKKILQQEIQNLVDEIKRLRAENATLKSVNDELMIDIIRIENQLTHALVGVSHDAS